MEKGTITHALAKRFRIQRELAELTQREAATKIEMTYQQLSRIETGVSTPTIARMIRMATVYGCVVADFFVDVDNRLREEQRKLYYIVDEAAAVRANLTELTHALAYLIDLTWSDIRRAGNDREADVALLEQVQENLKKLRKNTLEEGK